MTGEWAAMAAAAQIVAMGKSPGQHHQIRAGRQRRLPVPQCGRGLPGRAVQRNGDVPFAVGAGGTR